MKPGDDCLCGECADCTIARLLKDKAACEKLLEAAKVIINNPRGYLCYMTAMNDMREAVAVLERK